MGQWNVLKGVAVLLLGLGGQASAHDVHFTIDATSQLVEDADGRLTGIRMGWLHDAPLSQMILEGEDLTEGQRAATLKALADRLVGDLHSLGYFTHLTLDGKALPTAAVSDYQLELGEAQRLNLAFLLPLATPQDLTGKRLDIALFDAAGAETLLYKDTGDIALGEKIKAACDLTLEQKQQDDAHGGPAQIAHLQCR